MDRYPGTRSPRRDWRLRVAFLVIGCLAVVAALFVGVSDNPPGIILVYVASTSFLLVIVCHWRRVKSFVILLISAIVGFPVTVVLHNVFDVLAGKLSEIAFMESGLNMLGVAFFVIALVLCPPAAVIGAVGSLVRLFLSLDDHSI